MIPQNKMILKAAVHFKFESSETYTCNKYSLQCDQVIWTRLKVAQKPRFSEKSNPILLGTVLYGSIKISYFYKKKHLKLPKLCISTKKLPHDKKPTWPGHTVISLLSRTLTFVRNFFVFLHPSLTSRDNRAIINRLNQFQTS